MPWYLKRPFLVLAALVAVWFAAVRYAGTVKAMKAARRRAEP